MPSLNDLLAQEAAHRRQLLGLPEEDPLDEYAVATPPPAPAPAPAPAPEPAQDFEPEPLPAAGPEASQAMPEMDLSEAAPIGEPLQGGDAVDVPPDVVDAPPAPEPEPQDPLMAAVASLIAKQQRQGTGGSGPAPEDNRGALAGEAIYKGFLRKPLEADFFKRAQAGSATGKPTDPLALLKFMADERERKWGHKFKESGQEAKELAKALDQTLRERGLVTGEKRLEQGEQHFQTKEERAREEFRTAEDRKNDQFKVATKLKEQGMDAHMAEEQSKRLEKYRKDTEDVQAADAALTQINDLLPGGIPNTSKEIDALVGSGAGFGIIDRLKDRLPGGIGSWLGQPDNAKALRIAYGNLQDVVRHPITGSNFTKGEMENMSRQFGDRLLEDPRSMYLAIQYFRAVTASKIRKAEASTRLGVSPVTWQMYEQMGGLTSRNPMYGNPSPQLENVADPTQTPIRNTVKGDIPTVDKHGDLRTPSDGPGDKGLKANVPVTDPGGEVVDPMTAKAQPAGDGYRRVYEPGNKRTAVIAADGTLVDYEDGDTRKSRQATGR